jgi:hypothetical protein
MKLVRRVALVVLSFLAAGGGGTAQAQHIASADLQIQGVGLRVITVSVTTGIDIPASIQTEFGGKQNDEAPAVEGLVAVGELDGPGIELPIRLETAPGHKFTIPGLSREGVYFLRNIRLMKGTEFLQSATPSIATITVSNLLQTAVKVRQLTPEELRARGITIDARNYEVFEYTFSFFIDNQLVEIPYPVIIDKRTREVRPLPKETPFVLPPIQNVIPPRWSPPGIYSFGLGPGGELPEEEQAPEGGGGGGRPSIPAALVIPNNLAVLHQFFAVTLMVTNGAPEGSSVTLDGVTAMIRTPTELKVVKSIPAAAFNQPIPVVDATTGVTFLVAQAKGDVDWTIEGLRPGTHTLEVEVRATYKSPGQADFPLKGTVRASIVVHDPRFNITFSHPDTVRKGIDYTTYSFITNMSAVAQTIRVGTTLQTCAQSPLANVCRVDDSPEVAELTIPSGEMRMIEYKLRPSVTGSVFATAGSVSDDNISAAVQLHMGVSESGIPLSPATLVMPYYAQFVNQTLVEANLQLLGLGYSLATAPLTQALAKHPKVIKTDVFMRAVDIARAGHHIFLGEESRDALAHMTLDLLGNGVELREWDELRRREESGRTAGASVVRELEKGATDIGDFVDRFASKTAHRNGYVLALLHGPSVAGNERPFALAARGVASNRKLQIPNEAESGWIRELPFADLSKFTSADGSRSGEIAVIGRWTEALELTLVPSVGGPHSLELIYPAATDGTLLRAHIDLDGPAGRIVTVTFDRGEGHITVRDGVGGIMGSDDASTVTPEDLVLIGARQDLHLDPHAHKVSVLFNRPTSIADGDDWLTKFHGQIILDKDGVNYTGVRPISSAALQDSQRVVNLTFDHALSQNASYSIAVDPVRDPISGASVSFSQPLTPVIDNDAPGGIIFGHVLKGDNTPIADAEVVLTPDKGAAQYDISREGDGSFLFEFVPRDIDNNISGAYAMYAITTDDKVTRVEGAVRLPGRVHFVNLVFLGRGSAEGYVRYDNGQAVAGARVTIGSTMFDQFKTTETDANGFYQVEDLPVGPLTLSATDDDGNVTFAASEIKTPGQVLVKDLSIYRRPFPGVGVIRGIVKRSDTGAAVPGAHVGVYSQGYGLVDDFTDSTGRFEFTEVPTGFVTVLAAEWTVSRESVALDFDLAPDERRDLVLTLNVAPNDPLVTIEGDVIRENPLYPGDASKYERVAGALVKIESGQVVTADANGHYVIQSVPASASGKDITGYDPLTTRSRTIPLPALSATGPNLVPIFIDAASGQGTGTVRVRVLSATGVPVSGLRVIEPGFPPTIFNDAGNGVYTLGDVKVGRTVGVWAISLGGTYGDQFTSGAAKVEFNGHVAALTLRLGGQGTVRVKLQADIEIIGDVSLTYSVWDEAEQATSPKTVTANTAKNGLPDYAVFEKVPAVTQDVSVASVHPVYGHAGQTTKLAFDGDLKNITLQLNKLSTIRGVVYAIDGRTPIPGAAVRLEDGRQDQGIYTTLPDGSFVFYNVPAATGFRILAEITQNGVYRTGFGSGTTPSLGGPVDNVAVVLRTQGSIDGRIVYSAYKVYDPQNPANNVPDDTPTDLSDNAPVPLARFYMKELDFPRRDFGTQQDTLGADILGRFSFNNVFTGPLRVSASDPGNQEMRGTWTGTLTQEGERLTAIVGIGGIGFGSASVTVVDPNNGNAPVLNAEVSLFKGGLFDFATTDGAGHVQFDQIPAGTYSASAYSKALGKSGGSGFFTVTANENTDIRIVLEFSGEVTGRLIDPEDNGRGIPGAHVNLKAFQYDTRATTDTLGGFIFEGVREGQFSLTAKDTLSNRRASATRTLTQADPRPNVILELEPIETLYLSVYEPNDTGGNSNVLVPIVEATVRQRGDDFLRALQGNPFVMEGVLEQPPYSVSIKEIGGQHRELSTSASFPVGSASNPLKLVLPAYGSVEVHVTQGSTPAVNAKVRVSGGNTTATVYTDNAGVAVATGIRLGSISVQASTLDNAFSGSASSTLASQSTPAVVNITLGAFAGVTGYVEAELGGPSVGTRVVATWPGRSLEMFTDSNGRYVFQGISTGSTVNLVYVGPDDITVGARQSYVVKSTDASQTVTLPNVKLDATPPQLVSFSPPDGAQNVSPDTTLEFVFSEPIQSQYVNKSYIQLLPADSSTAVNATYTSFTDTNGTFVVRLTPPPPAAGKPFPLESNTLYRIVVSGEVRDLTGNRMPGSRGSVFTTTDYAQPSVVKVTPPVTQPLSSATIFQFQFNEPIDPAPWGTGGNGVFHLYKISQAGATGTIVREIPGRAFVDPESSLTLIFSPDEPMEAQSFYRTVFSGVRDMQGNAADAQTFHFFSFDTIQPFVILQSPVPEGFPLISGVEYTLVPVIRDTDANGPVSTDIARVDYLRVEGETETFIKSETKSPYSYRFVAPDVPAGGAPFTLRAEALDLSGNTSAPATITWTVQPNRPPQNVAITLTPATSSYAGNRVHATVAFEDEGILATVQVVLTATQSNGATYTKSLVQQATRANVNAPWPTPVFDFDLPATLQEGSTATFTANVTDARGQTTSVPAPLAILEDLTKPAVVSMSPPAESRFPIGFKYQIEAVVQDLESGVQRVVFTFDGQTITVLGTDPSVTPGFQPRSWRFVSGQITVPAKNVDTRIPVTVTAYDYHGNVQTFVVEIVYIGVNDPTVPKGAWLCPLDRAALPANQTALSINLQVRATDDISVTGVKFVIPGIATPVPASRVGTTDTWQATTSIATPAAGTEFSISAIVSDASTEHDVTLPIAITLVDADVFVDDRVQAITSADVANYENKTIVVRGSTARLVPHVPITLKNLIVLQGGIVETLSTTTTVEHKLDLTISENLYVDCASAIDVSSRGYLGGWGLSYDGSGKNNDPHGRTVGNTITGGASTFSSASHGGTGGIDSGAGTTNATYGEITNPIDLGAGGGGATNGTAGAAGGGAIRLQGDTFAISGAIRADGGSRFGSAHAGAGGSVNLEVRQLITGPSARIAANGGDDDVVNNASRGGGGGRVAVVATERFEVETLGLNIAARGGRNGTTNEGATYLDGGAGTVYLKRPGQTLGELFVGNYDERRPATLHLSRYTPVSDPSGTLHFDRVELGQRALLRGDSSIDVGGVIDDRASIVADNSAVVLFPNDQPTLSVTTAPLAESSIPQGGTLSATYSATSLAGIGNVTLAWTPVTPDRSDANNNYPTTAAPSPITLAVPTSAVVGPATLTVSATDRAERATQNAPLPFTIIANAPPAITKFEVVPPSLYPGKSVVATISASDDLKVTKVTLTSTINNGTPATQTKTPNTAVVTDSTLTVAVPITTPGGAPMTLDLGVEDAFPGRTATTQTVNVIILTDTIAPSLNVTSPASGTIYQEGTGALIQVRATATDAEVGVKQVYVQIDGGTQYPLTAGANGSWSADIPVPNVDGIDVVTKQLVVTAKDYESNTTAAPAIPIQIRPLNDPNAPVVQWTCSTVGALYPANAAAKLRVYAIGNDVGNAANGIQKVELFVADSTTPILATAVSGLANHYEATYTIPSDAVDGSTISVRALATNTAGLSSDVTTQITVVAGTILTANTTISASDTTYDGQTVIVQSGTLTVSGQHAFARLVVLGGAKVTHVATSTSTIERLTFDANAMYVACDASIDVTGLGFTGASAGYGRTWSTGSTGSTTGGSYNGAGGSHGGRGGAHDSLGDSAPTYGSVHDPNEPGGAGGQYSNATCNPCNTGGGIARIVAQTFTLDGKVLANGIQGSSGSGAGGSIRIDAQVLGGVGEIRADGGVSNHAAGGGGRIALYVPSLTLDRTKITAAGGLHSGNPTRTGAAGTVYFATGKELLLDNSDRVSAKTTPLPDLGSGTVLNANANVLTLSAPVPEWIEGSLIEIDGARYTITARTATTVTVSGTPNVAAGAAYRGMWSFDQITARRQSTLETATLRVPLVNTTSTGLVRVSDWNGEGLTLRGRLETSTVDATTLAVQNGGHLAHSATTGTKINTLTIDVDTLTVDAASSIDVSGRGFTGSAGGYGRTWPNASTGGSYNGAGGSHGGRGGAHDSLGESASTYGSAVDPGTPGGAGGQYSNATCDPCNSGGGVARIHAQTIALDGKLLANGIQGSSGSGAGGSIGVDAGNLSGSGEIRADGGLSNHAAGGGGRIAVYYRTLAFDRTKITAAGGLHSGNAVRTAGAGTVYFREVDANGAKVGDELVLDNRDRGTTRVTPLFTAGAGTVTEVNGSVVTLSAPVPDWIEGSWIDFFDATGAKISQYLVVSHTATTVTVDAASPNVSVGNTYRGVARFDLVTIRGAALVSSDSLDTPVLASSTNSYLSLNDLHSDTLTLRGWVKVDGTVDVTTLALESGARLEVDGLVKSTDLTLTGGAVLTQIPTTSSEVTRLLVEAVNLTVDATSSIDVSGRGYTGASGGYGRTWPNLTTGGSYNGAGGSHGGRGGAHDSLGDSAQAYGSVHDPNEPGGAGGQYSNATCNPCNSGGGIARIVAQTFTLNGKVLANGIQGSSGSGAGGSIRIDAQSLSGTGEIRADGGLSNHAAGGGGRIALYVSSLTLDRTKITAAGGLHSGNTTRTAAAGTVYFATGIGQVPGEMDDVIIDNSDRVSAKDTLLPSLGTGTITAVNGTTLTLSNPVPEWIEGSWIDTSASLSAGSADASAQIVARTTNTVTLSATLDVQPGAAYRGSWRFAQLTARRQGVVQTDVLRVPQIDTTATALVRVRDLRGDDVVLRGRIEASGVATRNLTLQNSAFLTHPPTNATTTNRLTVDVLQTISVDATSSIDASGRGYTGATSGYGRTWPNTTTGGSYNGAGGSHGGRGGAHDSVGDSGPTYGSLFDPILPGAAGGQYSNGTCDPCNSGGGILRIAASALAIDGKVLANGSQGSSGSGAGGSIRIDAQTISGTGEIRADGGLTNHAAGGGGRIAVYYNTLTLDRAKILALGGLHSGNTTRTAAAGTVYLKQTAQTYGDLIVDNTGRTATHNTALVSVGYRTVTAFGTTFVRDSAASFPAPDFLARIRLVLNHDKTTTWPIVSNDATTLNVDVSANALTAQNGDAFRGLYRFDNVKLRNARLEVLDLFESVNAIDKDAPSVLLGSNLSPLLTPSLISLQSTATGSSILGSAGAATDPDQPITLTATNLTSGNTFTVNANIDGSFALPVQGNAGDAITLKAKDANFFPLESPVLNVGTLQFGTPAPTQIDKSAWAPDTNFRARHLAMDDRNLLVHGGASDDLTILSIADPARPAFVRTVNISNGVINDVAISNGWAIIASSDLVLLDLSSTTSSPIYLPDQGYYEYGMAVAGGYVYVSTNNGNDGRIRIYDISAPASPRYVREQGIVSGLTWDSLLSYGNYLVAISGARPNGVGHDVVVIDRTNINSLVKIADVDVPSFDANYGRIAGGLLYLTSAASRDVVVVDLSTPTAPAVLGRVTAPSNAGRSAVVKTTAFVADTASGLVEIDASNPATPTLVGAVATTGTAYDVNITAPYAYVANDIGLAIVTISTPPQVEPSRIRMSAQGTNVVVTGTARAVLGAAPLTVAVHDVNLDTTASASVAADGSFTVTVSALAGDVITIEATDGASRTSGVIPLGHVPFGSGVGFIPLTPAITGEASYRARTLATDGAHLIVGGYGESTSTRLVIFDVTDPAAPVYKRTVALNNGPINNVAISGGWAVIAANELILLDLNSQTSSPIYLPDQGYYEYDVLVRDGYAFTTTNNGNDARIRIYEASSLPAARYIREQAMGISGLTFSGLAALGSRYLIGISDDRPNNVGHDVVVIDRSNAYNLVKVADLDIPNFNGYRGKVLGTTLYLAGTSGGLAVVDLANPALPVLKTIVPQADARGVDAIGATVAVANGSAGVTFLHLGDPHAPSILGTQSVGGSAWSVAFNGGNLYVANQQGLAVIQNIASAPMVDPERITITPESGTLATIAGSANSVRGAAPLTVEVKNGNTGASLTKSVAGDGSFSVLLPAMVGESVTVEATDVADRVSGPVPVGSVPFGTAVTTYRIDSNLTGQNYFARTLATDGTWLIVGGYQDGGTTKLVVYDVTDPEAPVFRRVVTLNNGPINNVGLHRGWAVIAANELILLDLGNPNSSPIYLPDQGYYEYDVLVAGGYAFTSTNNGNDARIRIYDISRPDAPRYVREQSMGIAGLTFSGVTALGSNYLIGISSAAPNGTGHDVVVIDRSNVHSLVKVADLDIPGFSAFRGKVVGSTLYLAGTTGGMAIVDVSDPSSPSLVKIMTTGGSPHGVDGTGSLLAIADGGSGVTFADIANPANVKLIGTQRVGGHAWSLVFNRGNIYVANDQGLVVIRNVGTAPIVMASLISITSDGAGTATITGTDRSISGAGTLTFEARNSTTGLIVNAGTVPADGSFTVDIAAQPGDALTIEATDEANRKSGRVFVGTVPFGNVSSAYITPAMSGEGGYRPRTLAADGTHLVVGGYGDTGTTRLIIYDISEPGPPEFVRAVPLNNGPINNVAIHNGWAVIAANELIVLDLSSTTSVPIYLPDQGYYEYDVLVAGGYAFTSTNNGNDARIRIYDIANPAAPRYIREQAMGIGGVTFSGLAALGSDYILGFTSARPNNVGHDVVVIDRKNIYSLAKVADLDIASFDAFRGKVAGTTLYLGGVAGGLAVVDLSDPVAPLTKMVLQTAGDAFGGDATGSTFAVADGSAGITFLDITNPFVPQVRGTQPTGGTVWSTQFCRGALYAVNEQGVVMIDAVAAPVIDRSRVTLATTSATQVAISGTASAIGGVAPLTINVRNARTNVATGAISVASNGSFTATLAAVPNDPLELTVIDGGARTSVLSLGAAPFGTTTTVLAGSAQATGDPNFRARRIASDGTNTVVGSGSGAGLSVSGSNRVVVYRPTLTKAYTVSGPVNELTIYNGCALIAANDFASLNLADANATPYNAPDYGYYEYSVAVLGTYAYTSTNNGNDARVRIYNITNPAQPVYYREQGMGISLTFTKLLPLGTNYLIGISPERPGGVGHDLVLIDATNPAALVKLADVDVPNFDAVDGVVEGTTVYLVGGGAGVAVLDFVGTPSAPSFTTAILDTPGSARGVTLSGTRQIAVADGSAGVTFIDATTPTAPVLLGTHALGSTNTVGVHAVGQNLYAASDNHFHTITRP